MDGVAQQHPELGLRPNDVWNGAKQDLAMRAISQDYVNVLNANRIAPTMPNMFMLHFLGEGGGPKFIKEMGANPNANAAALFPKEAKYNPTIFWDKAGQPRSLQQVYALMTKSFGGPQTRMAPIEPLSAETMKSFEQPQTPASEAAAPEVQADLPAPLPGMKLDAAPEPSAAAQLPPLLPGLKLDYTAADPMQPKAGYTDAQHVYHPGADEKKPEVAAPEIMGVDANGEPIFADPKAQEEYFNARAGIGKAAAAGLASNVTGALEWLPNQYGGAAAERGSEALKAAGEGHPWAYKAGAWAPAFAPLGEVIGAGKAGAEALETGASIVPSMLKGMGWGAAEGGLIGATTPTGEPDYGTRAATKAGETAAGVGIGLAGGAAGPVLGKGLQFLGREISNVFGSKVGKAAEELRTGLDATTGKELTKEQKAADVATVQQAAEETVITKQAQRESTPPEEVGAELQPVISADRKAGFERRKKESGFAEVVKSDNGLPLLNTEETTGSIENIEKRFNMNLEKSEVSSRHEAGR